MTRDIGQGLLRDAEEMRFGFVGQAARVTGVHRYLDSGARGEAIRQPAQSCLQPKIVEDGGAQQLRHLPHIADGFIHQVEAIGKPRAPVRSTLASGGSQRAEIRSEEHTSELQSPMYLV